jgi:hypothetical protein
VAHSIRGALEYASAELKSDREIVMEAVAQEDQKQCVRLVGRSDLRGLIEDTKSWGVWDFHDARQLEVGAGAGDGKSLASGSVNGFDSVKNLDPVAELRGRKWTSRGTPPRSLRSSAVIKNLILRSWFLPRL